MQAYLVKSVFRLRRDLIVDGDFLNKIKIGTKLKCQNYEFLVKGVTLGLRSAKYENKSGILLEPMSKIDDEKILINQILETIN